MEFILLAILFLLEELSATMHGIWIEFIDMTYEYFTTRGWETVNARWKIWPNTCFGFIHHWWEQASGRWKSPEIISYVDEIGLITNTFPTKCPERPKPNTLLSLFARSVSWCSLCPICDLQINYPCRKALTYWSGLLIFALGCFSFSSPFLPPLSFWGEEWEEGGELEREKCERNLVHGEYTPQQELVFVIDMESMLSRVVSRWISKGFFSGHKFWTIVWFAMYNEKHINATQMLKHVSITKLANIFTEELPIKV